MVPKREGEMHLNHAARLLEVSVKTVRTWARRAVEGDPSRLQKARRDPANRYYVNAIEVYGLRDEHRRNGG